MRPLQLFSRILIAASVLVLSSISSRGQGIPWYALPLPIPGGFVDASTGNLHLEIPWDRCRSAMATLSFPR